MKTLSFLSTALAVVVGAGTFAVAAPNYQITPIDNAGGIEAHPFGINNAGQIVGYMIDANGDHHAVKWTGGVGAALPTLVANDVSEAYRINQSGAIAGKARSTTNDLMHAAMWDNAGVHDVGTLGGATSFANDINESGVVAGSSDALHGSHAFTWTLAGGFVDYGSFNPNNNLNRAGFNGINNTGLMTGTAYVLFSPFKAMKAHVGDTSLTPLSPNGQFSNGMGMAVNDAGTIVGFQSPASGGSAHAAIFGDGGNYMDLGALGLTDSQALDINEPGDIVGEAFGDDGNGNFLSRAFLYQNGTMSNLLDLIPGNSGWTDIFEAKGINDLGQIVGFGVYNDEFRAFVMSPVPEPASATLLSVGAISLLARRRRLRRA